MSVQNQVTNIDYLFAGAGASATLLLMSMEKRGLLLGKNIVILDPDAKSKNDKTYCFWGNPGEMPASQCKHLVSYQWGKVSVNQNQTESLFPLKYYHISSSDLYNELNRIVLAYNLKRIQASVLDTDSSENGVKVKTDKGIWQSNTVFDSRPPKYLTAKKNEVHLLQSFIGFVIETETPISDEGCINLMDFDIVQQGWTQFVYVLPFNEHKILVELTRFGKESIILNEAEPILNQYISKRFGHFKILEIETGTIPMSTVPIDADNLSGLVSIGGKAGAVKPSTGYAFKNMFKHAEILADSLQKGIQLQKITSPSRFKFYDRLLLLILSRKPAQGKAIFQALFQKNKTLDVLKFLDEKTTIYQDVSILITLPFKPFMSALWWEISAKLKNLLVPISVLFVALGLSILHASPTPEIFSWINIALLFIGLFFVGIPHGALDHFLESKNLQIRVSFNFIIHYLSAFIAYFILWLLIPNAALFLFLFYSAWHFGQGDMKEWQLRNRSLKSWVWGTFLLGIILIGHVVETNLILRNLDVYLLPLNASEGKIVSILLVTLTLIWGVLERKPAMLISCCMLAVGIQLPLITSFGLYFIGQHSMNGWSHLKNGLNTSHVRLFLKALPFTLGAFALFATMLFCHESGYLNAFKGQVIPAFFVFISCISLPHVISMNSFYKKSL